MLTRAGLLPALSLAFLLLLPGSASADECREVVECKATGACEIVVVCDGEEGGGTGGGGGGGGGEPVSQRCFNAALNEPTPCHSSMFGWWSQPDQCYFLLLEPQPPASDPAWMGNHPDGAVYQATCPFGGAGTGGGWFWRAVPPPGYGGLVVDPAVLAEQAVESMQLRAAPIGIVPRDEPGSMGLIGLPTYMWIEDPGPSTWGPITRSASAGGVTVTATAEVTQAVWDMGDGTTVTCASSGTPYEARFQAADSPTCGHRYERAGTYPVSVTTYWEVTWDGGGQSGVIDLDFTDETTIRMGEMQALVTRP